MTSSSATILDAHNASLVQRSSLRTNRNKHTCDSLNPRFPAGHLLLIALCLANLQVRQDIISSLKLSQPAVLTSSFNRPNIHYTILLLDVQQPEPQAAAAHSTAAAESVGRPGMDDVLGGDVGDVLTDDLDHAGYGHLLQLLKPAGKARQGHRAGGQQQQQQQQEGQQRQWPGPITIVYALKRWVQSLHGASFCTCDAVPGVYDTRHGK